MGGCDKCCSILPILLRPPGGGEFFYVSYLSLFCLSVTILKNPYKTKTNKARMLFFSVEGTYHRGELCLENFSLLPQLGRAPGGDIFGVCHNCFENTSGFLGIYENVLGFLGIYIT